MNSDLLLHVLGEYSTNKIGTKIEKIIDGEVTKWSGEFKDDKYLGEIYIDNPDLTLDQIRQISELLQVPITMKNNTYDTIIKYEFQLEF